MSTSGRKPKSGDLKGIEGGKSGHARGAGHSTEAKQDRPKSTGRFRRPRGLADDESRYWKMLQERCAGAESESETDSASFEHMVRVYTMARRASKLINKARRNEKWSEGLLKSYKGSGELAQADAVSIFFKAWSEYEKCAEMFGINPEGRVRFGTKAEMPEDPSEIPQEVREAMNS